MAEPYSADWVKDELMDLTGISPVPSQPEWLRGITFLLEETRALEEGLFALNVCFSEGNPSQVHLHADDLEALREGVKWNNKEIPEMLGYLLRYGAGRDAHYAPGPEELVP